MLTKETLEALSKEDTTRVLNHLFNEQIPAGAEPSIIVPEKFNIKTLESLQEFRNNFRGNFSTNDIKSFVNYCGHYLEKSDDTETDGQIFVNPDKMAAKAIYDIGSIEKPGHCRHKGRLSLPKGAAFRALENIDSQKLDQEDFSNFLEDWKSIISTVTSSNDEISVAIAVTEVRKVTITALREMESSIDNFENSASVSERVGANNKDSLPAFIKFKCTPYLGLKEREILVRVSLLTGGQSPMFILRIVGIESLQEDLGNEFMELIEKKCKSQRATIFVGDFDS